MVNNIREARLRLGLTQFQLAKKLNISDSFLSQLENGRRTLTLQMAIDISTAIGMELTEIFLLPNMTKCKVNNETTTTLENYPDF
jgi:transcriptional regulator with XRE-family HTH domain